MKKLSLYIFLVLILSSCSENNISKLIENCADYTQFQESMDAYNTGYTKLFKRLKAEYLKAEFNKDKAKIKSLDKEIELACGEGATRFNCGIITVLKIKDKQMKKGLKMSIEKKIEEFFSYEYNFMKCEKEQKESPIMFEEKWKKRKN